MSSLQIDPSSRSAPLLLMEALYAPRGPDQASRCIQSIKEHLGHDLPPCVSELNPEQMEFWTTLYKYLQDDSLVKVWPRLRMSFPAWQALPREASATEIRHFFRSPEAQRLAQEIHKLELHNLGLLVLPEEIRTFQNLTALNLSNNRIKHLTQGFSSFRRLKGLDLRENLIEKISPAHFTSYPDLEHLYLGNNVISRIDRVFDRCTKLQKVDLSANRITHMAKNVFEHCPRLRDVYLNDNQLTHIPDIGYYLKEEEMEGNPINLLAEVQLAFRAIVNSRFVQLASFAS